MSYWKGPTFKVIKAMKERGNQPGLIQKWMGDAAAWAKTNTGPNAEAIRAWAPHWVNRPFYTAQELTNLFPVLAVSLGLTEQAPPAMSAARLENELRFGGLPVIMNKDGTEFFIVHGKNQRLFAVERLKHWKSHALSQSEMESYL